MTKQRKRGTAVPSKALVRQLDNTKNMLTEARALVRRLKGVGRPAPNPEPPAPMVLDAGVLLEAPAFGGLGLVEIKLSPAEEAVLNEPVNPSDVLIKPTGQPYLSHPTYTRWFNRAFGRLGWSIVPVGLPKTTAKGAKQQVVVPYVLYIHGKPAAGAYGEQEFFEDNREQSPGDALEATVASGLRRCAKRLGVGLELWDRDWLATWTAASAVEVPVLKFDREGGRKAGKAWRRVKGPRLPGEVDPREVPAAERPVTPLPEVQYRDLARPAESQPSELLRQAWQQGAVITEKQVRRFFAILKNSGRNEAVVKEWLGARYGITSSKQIASSDYEAICTAIQSSAPLPGKG